MLGAIAGDMIGAPYEHVATKTTDFPLFGQHSYFTDDTVLTVAVAFAIMTDGDYAAAMRIFGRTYPQAGYGQHFRHWLLADEPRPYGSYGNGSAMRVSPIGFAFATEAEVMAEAERSAACTHDHPEGIAGAQAVALAVHLGRQGSDKEDIRREISGRFGYDLRRTIADIRPDYAFDISCQGSVPEAILSFLDSEDFESAVRLAVSLGGDADTQACVAGAIAQAFYGGVPAAIVEEVCARLPRDMQEIVGEFGDKFGLSSADAP
jgi:ADP-ribosylglycohydrolase